MQPRYHFDAVDRVLQDIKDKKILFGGIPVVLGGDFSQKLPVVKRGRQYDIVNACIQCWNNWPKIRVLFLIQNMRVVSGELNRRFATCLGDLPYNRKSYGVIKLPEWIITTDDRAYFHEFVYPLYLLRADDSDIFRGRAILSSRNDNVIRFNSEITQLITDSSRHYFSADQIQSDEWGDISDFTPKYLQTLPGQGLPQGILTLHVGMPIMLLRNYYTKLCLCNETRLIITRLYNHYIKGRNISKDPRDCISIGVKVLRVNEGDVSG